MDVGFKTDKGIARENNEDNFFVDVNEGLFIVADGVGGHNAGEVASRIAVEEIGHYIINKRDKKRTGCPYIFKRIDKAINLANEKVLKESSEKDSLAKMATTVVVLLISKGVAYISNVGDSRAYLFRKNRVFRLTEDHTVANKLVREGRINSADVEALAESRMSLNMFNTITRAVGDKNGATADNFFVDIEPEDIFLLCTDGLHGELSDKAMQEIINSEENAQNACDKLIEEANIRGGKDNITAILIKIGVMDHE